MPKPIPGKLPKIPTGEIRWITDKHHVSESAFTVAREIRRRTSSKKARSIWTWEARRCAMRYAVMCHKQNQRLYRYVMSGSLGRFSSCGV